MQQLKPKPKAGDTPDVDPSDDPTNASSVPLLQSMCGPRPARSAVALVVALSVWYLVVVSLHDQKEVFNLKIQTLN